MRHKLQLSAAWRKSMQMWKFIDIELKKCPELDPELSSVHEMKMKFIKERYPWDYPLYGCYFCEYAKIDIGSVVCTECRSCPGRLIDPDFNCEYYPGTHVEREDYHWKLLPHEFYLKLKYLYGRYKNG